MGYVENFNKSLDALSEQKEPQELITLREDAVTCSALGVISGVVAATALPTALTLALICSPVPAMIIITLPTVLIAAVATVALGILAYDLIVVGNNQHEQAEALSKLLHQPGVKAEKALESFFKGNFAEAFGHGADAIGGAYQGGKKVYKGVKNELNSDIPYVYKDTLLAQYLFEKKQKQA